MSKLSVSANRRSDQCAPAQLDQPTLEKFGWLTIKVEAEDAPSLGSEMLWLSERLGVPAFGRARRIIEEIKPQPPQEAAPSSLSAVYGLGAFPFHVDTSHWPVPCRYIVLGCAVSDGDNVPTHLVDRHHMRWTDSDMRLLSSAVFHVRSGRNSFYASIFGLDRRFIRFDPGCMEPVTADAREAMRLFIEGCSTAPKHSQSWQPGTILIIDNWRMLHARGDASHGDISRILLRCNVR